jgi:lipopolysaccharide/colanic/teichoic acid biosynthesis glycosyltransferase
MAKRAFDILSSAIGLLIMLPIMILIALFIFIDDRQPVFFKQIRIGLNLQPFILYKFRSMTVNDGSSIGSFDAGNISRVTKTGMLLRKSKLDELPQLFNVLKGDMSIVGPRPEVKQFIEVYPERWAIVSTVKPGITDNASIEFRNEEEILVKSQNPEKTYIEEILPQKLKLYEQYVNSQSFLGDLKIILRTFYVIILK